MYHPFGPFEMSSSRLLVPMRGELLTPGSALLQVVKLLSVLKILESFVFFWVNLISKSRLPTILPPQFLKTFPPYVSTELNLGCILVCVPQCNTSEHSHPYLFNFTVFVLVKFAVKLYFLVHYLMFL